jgi:hypothetical protein
MAEIHFLDSNEYSFLLEIRSMVMSLVADVEPGVRTRLPMLPRLLNLTIHPTRRVIPETGHSGFTMSKDWIHRDQPLGSTERGLHRDSNARPNLRPRAAPRRRYAALGPQAQDDRVISAAVFEGPATVFQAGITPAKPPWTQYDESVVDDWATELLALPPGTDPGPWRFKHLTGAAGSSTEPAPGRSRGPRR